MGLSVARRQPLNTQNYTSNVKLNTSRAEIIKWFAFDYQINCHLPILWQQTKSCLMQLEQVCCPLCWHLNRTGDSPSWSGDLQNFQTAKQIGHILRQHASYETFLSQSKSSPLAYFFLNYVMLLFLTFRDIFRTSNRSLVN